MSPIIFRYVVRTYLAFFVGILLAVLAIFLVADFVDRSKSYVGPNWVKDVMELYGYKALQALWQLGPAALLLAAGATVSMLRKRGEVSALMSLSFSPKIFYVPIAACAFAISCGFVIFDELVVTNAGRKVDEISLSRFGRWGDLRFHLTPKQWFRRGDHIYFLRHGDVDRGLYDVTVMKLSGEFRLDERIDAAEMLHVTDTVWLMKDVVVRRFDPSGAIHIEHFAEKEYDLPGAYPFAFKVRLGRPEQFSFSELREQIRTRRGSGLSFTPFSLALHNRFAYPLAAVPAALLAVGLALRQNRKGHLTASLVEGLSVAMVLWGMMVVTRTLVVSNRMDAGIAAWAPAVVLVIASSLVWLRREGFSRLRAARAS